MIKSNEPEIGMDSLMKPFFSETIKQIIYG